MDGRQLSSQTSSRCFRNSTWAASLSSASRARLERRWRTSSCQLRMRHLGQPLQRTKEFRPFLTQWQQLFLPRGSEAITPLPPPPLPHFPPPSHPPPLPHHVHLP